ncbi:Hypothetical predicted protein [Cloeon dipterum]|uniref:Uncharacterized protein n=1 Tax=Cloeon dipterum TaxID=197152 RepID=A0A8S1DWJ3_9INSE|nr:Hypothetical predicted protein [Cloeon dipterum]
MSSEKIEAVEERVEIDAVHQRFQSREHLLFICPQCKTKKPTEERIQRHFLKKKCFPINSACTQCGGPVFFYTFGPKETRLSHDCEKWAEFSRKLSENNGNNCSIDSDASSIAETESSLASSYS